ncbi:ABC transporter permease [Streptomyces sp. NPDC059524]|uniref:ABC transporter permease n=1 Tax=Streptomyces sp. NPDC059524 TaxID=3346856 RepID=UPI0036A469B2
MREFLLGLRLLVGSGRGNRVRFALMAAGGAVGVCCLTIVLSISGILEARDARTAAREPEFSKSAPGGSGAYGFTIQRDDPFGSRQFTRVFLAPGTDRVPPAPPGVNRFPRPGEFFVSPRLAEALAEYSGLKQRLPGRQAGVIGREGVADPDELFAYVGVSRAMIPEEGHRFNTYGDPYGVGPTVEASALEIVRFTMIGVVLLPLGVFLAVCARLSAASRARRLAALRLLGLSTKGIQRVNAVETVVAALFAGLLGLGLYTVLNQVGAKIGLPGLKWYPEDATPDGTTIAVCLIGCPLLAWLVGRVSVREAARSPLAVRRTAVQRRPSRWGFIPLLAGAGIGVGYCVAGATGHAPRDTALSAVLIPSAVLLVGAGLALTLPVLAQFLSRRVAASTRSFTLNLAMRRNEVESGSALRVATGLVLVVFAGSLTQGVLIELDQVYRPDSPVQEYRIARSAVSERQVRELGRIPGVGAQVVEASSWTDPEEERYVPSASLLIGTCRQLEFLAPGSTGCVDGKAQRLRSLDPNDDQQLLPGEPALLRLKGAGRERMWKLTVPHGVVKVPSDGSSIVDGNSGIIVPPSAIPAGARFEGAEVVLASASDTDTVRSVLDGIGAVAPTVEIIPGVLNIDGIRQVALIKSLLGVGMVLGLIIGVAAYLVAAGDRAVERRGQVTALTLLGTRRRTLRAVQVAQVVMPLGIGLVLALVTGKLVESSYLVSGGGDVFWDGDGVPLLLASALGVVGIAALGSLPLVGRRIDPELIRRD